MIKLIAADMDGTLLTGIHTMDKETIDAIQKVQAQGIRFVIATGRIFEDVKEFLDQYDIHCEYLTMNGAEYYDRNGICRQGIYIPKETARHVYDVLRQFPKFNVEIYTDHGHFSADSRCKTLRGMLRRMAVMQKGLNTFRMLLNAAHNGHFQRMQYIRDIDAFFASNIQIAKFITFTDVPEDIEELRGELATVTGLALSSSFRTNIEINDRHATKGEALRRYIAENGISAEEVMVIGDGQNDLSMMKCCHTFCSARCLGRISPPIWNVPVWFIRRIALLSGSMWTASCTRNPSAQHRNRISAWNCASIRPGDAMSGCAWDAVSG